MNGFFLDLGLSWTVSKALPYVLWLVVGLLIFLFIKKRVKSRMAKVVSGLVIVIPFAVYFMVSPIYEGDFSNDSRTMKAEPSFGLKKNELTVLAIPNCPFCAGSIEQLNKIVERTGVDRINFIVITNQEEALLPYKEIACKEIAVSAVPDFELFDRITKGRFPTFVYSDGSQLSIWRNDGFGVRAKDHVESKLSK